MRDSNPYRDTDPKALAVYLELHRKMPLERKFLIALDMCELGLKLLEADVRARHPVADDREVLMRVASRRHDRETMIRVYGWDPELHQ